MSDLRTPFENAEQCLQTQYNWHEDRANYTDQQIGEMLNWIKTKKEQAVATEHHEVVDVNSLNEMQRLAYHLVNSYFDKNLVRKTLCASL